MRSALRAVLGQIAVESLAPQKNLERVAETCAAAAREAADLLVLPELVDLGQVPAFDAAFATRYQTAAEPLTGSFVSTVTDLAREHGLHIVIGVAERHPDIPQTIFNTATVIGPDGRVLGAQRKLHLPGHERHYFGVGDEVSVIPTDLGVLTAQICYDLYFPEVARVAALHGAEVLIGIANIPGRSEWPDRLAALAAVRAYENMQHVAIVNRVGGEHGVDYGGESLAAAPPGTIIARCPAYRPDLRTVVLDADAMVRERARRPVFADRRPKLYQAVTASSAPPPPCRPDRREH